MKRLRDARRIASVLGAALMAACAQPVKQPPTPAAARDEAAPHAAFEQRHRDRALALTREERWSEAEAHWQILALLRPDVEEYARQSDAVRARLKASTDARMQAAAEARRRGNAEQASLNYLKALSLDPGNASAFQLLRQIEKDRAPRSTNMKMARAMAKAAREVAPSPAPAAPYPAERRDLDYGAMLLHQGEYASSIKALETYLKSSPRDELGRRYLAQASVQLGQQRLQQGKREEAVALFDKAIAADPREAESLRGTASALRKTLADEDYQQGLRAYNSDIRLAIDYWERSLRHDPQHALAASRLRQARQADRNLRAPESTPGMK